MENNCPSEVFKPFQSNIITENCRAIAELELHERVDEIPRCLDTLKEMLRREIDLNPCLDDNFLIGFLRARKFHCQLAFNLLKKYYMAPVTYPSMFKNFTPRSCVNAINSNLHYFLPYRNSDGCAILLSKFGQWNPRTLSCDELLKFNIMCNEMALKNPVTQICGIITIADMKDFSWSHLLQIQISDVRCFVSTLQIYFHDTVHSLHKHISPEILPESLGGKLSNQPNQDFYISLLNSEESFIARQNYGYLSRRHLSK